MPVITSIELALSQRQQPHSLRGMDLPAVKSVLAAGNDGALAEACRSLLSRADEACAEAARTDGDIGDDAADGTRLERLAGTLRVLALAFYLAEDRKYAQPAARLLRTWFIEDEARRPPQLDFAHLGEGNGAAASARARHYLDIIEAEALLAGYDDWTQADRAGFRAWFRGGLDRSRANGSPARTRPVDADAYTDATNALRADELEAAYRLAAKRGEALEAMLARAETRNRELEGRLELAKSETRARRSSRATEARFQPPIMVLADVPPTSRPLLPGWFAGYLNGLSAKAKAVEMQALRDRERGARELLARLATGGQLGYGDLIRFAELAPCWPGIVSSAAFRAEAIESLVLAVGNQNFEPGDANAAISLFRFLIGVLEHREISRACLVLFIDLLTRTGHLREAQDWLVHSGLAGESPVQYGCLLANVRHPRHVPEARDGSSGAWLAALNMVFAPSLLDPVELTDGDGPPLYRLHCPLPADAAVNDGPLVSVLMTTYEPDSGVALAIRSVLSQTWRNLELIIVDDASSEKSFAVLRELAAVDRRITVLRNEVNQGTYVAKNRGLSIARGELVTCHDSDDWSHPRKIELQVKRLLGSTRATANVSCWVRATDELVFQRFSMYGGLSYINTSSLLFRRAPVMERCGYWDSVRTGADTEYLRRIETVFERPVQRLNPSCPLSFGQVRDDSLTASASGGMSNGWISPRRINYRAGWEHWHKELDAGRTSPILPVESGRRPFPVPASLLPDRKSAAMAGAWDAVIVSDFRSDDPVLCSEVRAVGRGRRIALCQVNSFQPDRIDRLAIGACFQQLLHDGAASQVLLDDRIECRLLIVREAAVLQFLTAPGSAIRPEAVRIFSDAHAAGAEQLYDAAACSETARRIFGVAPTWQPRCSLLELLTPEVLSR